MEEGTSFDLQKSLNIWMEDVQSDLSVTESDSEELKSHLMDIMDELEDIGLDEEEAFMVASSRLGNRFDWADGFREANNPVIQMRRSLVILFGVQAYFFFSYFIKLSAKLLLLLVNNYKLERVLIFKIINRYLEAWHILFIIFVVTILLFEKRMMRLFEKIKIRPKHTLIVLLVTLLFAFTDGKLYNIARPVIAEIGYKTNGLFHVFHYFDYSFPFLISVGFIIIYSRYYKKESLY